MTPQEAIEIIKIAIAEVEWNYPMDYTVALEEAIEALEKQIPKKPIINLWDKWIECPVCNEVLSDDEGLPLGDGIDIDYCWSCGQAIDWRDTE